MKTLVAIELTKIFRKWRTYIGFLAIGILVPIVQLALYFTGDNYLNFATRNIQQSFEFVGNLFNGYLIGYIVLQALIIHIPFLIVLVGGDLLAGEATGGTYRMLITRPVSRSKIIAAKFIAGLIYTNLLLLFLMFMSLVLSLIIFGSGELLVLKSRIYIFAADDVLWRFILAYAFASLSMSVVLSLSFLFSSLVENAIGPIVTTMAVIIILLILSAINVDVLRDIRPYLFVTYMSQWTSFFSDPVEISEILKSVAVLIAHIFSFYVITLIIFNRKDILS
ncbi:MAG: ABC transporter permease [Bacteroidetes bacterium]|jgi:ABC-2 type transport system permease protein|nr:ABC transporter permease [Bacteroidota bacterium]